LQFQGVKQVARLHRKREVLKTGKVHEEEIFLISDMDHIRLDAQHFMHLKRDYWQIENKLHYRKDFVFGEDRSTIRARHGPENMSALRNYAISLLMANKIDNVKRCVDNLRYESASVLHQSLLYAA
jgi:serine phosphatase RsbU (regulator of sigma subunit)